MFSMGSLPVERRTAAGTLFSPPQGRSSAATLEDTCQAANPRATTVAGRNIFTVSIPYASSDVCVVECRFDLDLSSKPYKVMKYHNAAVRAVCYHTRYPLFASSSDDGSVQVFHGMVYSDLMTNPLVVPVKTLSIHKVSDYAGVTSLAFHPSQPWVFSGGGDGKACLVVDV